MAALQFFNSSSRWRWVMKTIDLLVMLLPLIMLCLIGVDQPSLSKWFMYGMICELVIIVLLVQSQGIQQASFRRSTLVPYLISLSLIWIIEKNENPVWKMETFHFYQGILMLIPLTLLTIQELSFASYRSIIQAHRLLHRIANREEWPSTLSECKNIPEVQAVREEVRDDPSLVLMLLIHPKDQVKIAALAILQYRKDWNKAHAEWVLNCARYSQDPYIRATALTALANINHSSIIQAMMYYLRDPSSEVRRAAAASLLWDGRKRWLIIRNAIRSYLSDPRQSSDGILPCFHELSDAAINDLTIWSGEAGVIGRNSTAALVAYYNMIIREEESSYLIDHMCKRIMDGSIPAVIRVELASMLTSRNLLPIQNCYRLIEDQQPTPLRIMAAEQILLQGINENVLRILRELALQPNRHIAVKIASVVQRCIHVDMGLTLGAPLPDARSRQAADVARRVAEWANQNSGTSAMNEGMDPIHYSSTRENISISIKQEEIDAQPLEEKTNLFDQSKLMVNRVSPYFD